MGLTELSERHGSTMEVLAEDERSERRGEGICEEQRGLAEDEKDVRGSLVTKVKKRVRWTDTQRPHPTTAIRRDQIGLSFGLHSQRGAVLHDASLGLWYVSSRTEWKDVHREIL